MYSAYQIVRCPRAVRTLALVVPIPTVLADVTVEMVPLCEWMLEKSFSKESSESEEGRSRMVLRRSMLQGQSIIVTLNDNGAQ